MWWQAYARGKEIRHIDLEADEGRKAFHALVADADFVIESFTNAERARLGVTYDQLARINPALINVSITAFGTNGPKADWPATDLTVWAASGAHVLAGDADRAPVRTSVPQAFLHAGADAAGAALIALHARHNSGLGQHVDVSAQQSSAQAALSRRPDRTEQLGVDRPARSRRPGRDFSDQTHLAVQRRIRGHHVPVRSRVQRSQSPPSELGA